MMINWISGTCIAPHLSSCCLHHRMHPLEIPKHCNMITLVVVAEIPKMNMTNKKTDMMRMIKLSMKTTMTMTNLLPAGEKLRPDQLGVELLLRGLEGACLVVVRRMVNISWMISWTRVLIIFVMNMMTSLARMISWTQMLTSWCPIKKSELT